MSDIRVSNGADSAKYVPFGQNAAAKYAMSAF
jgi:hypothetical protein